MKTTKDYYNKTALEWANNWYGNELLLPYLKEFFGYLPPNPKILDLCCGAGYESMRMQRLGADVTGLDFSEESIRIAKERNHDIRFVVDDMLNDYSYLGKFDGCAVIAGFVHLPNDKLSRAFEMIGHVLKDNGILFIAVRDGTGKSAESSQVTIEDQEYDREFYLHSRDELEYSSRGIFDYVKELLPDEKSDWKFYIFRKVSG